MTYKYSVAPFMAAINIEQSSADVAKQLESIISEYAASGWEFCQLGEVPVRVNPGCLGRFLGAKPTYVTYTQLIFRTPISN